MNEGDMFRLFIAFAIGGLVFGLWRDGVNNSEMLAEFCPVVLAHSLSLADSLAVIEAHNGCWVYVHPEAP